MIKYRIKEILGPVPMHYEVDKQYFDWAQELSDTYGLKYKFPLWKVIEVWTNYSAEVCASWLVHTPRDVERAFNLVLEEDK